MSNLFEINQAILNCIDLETGEIIDTAALDRLEMERDTKVENIALWIKNLNADAAALKAEKQALDARQKAAENKAESLKKYLAAALNGSKFTTPKVAITWRRSESVEVTDISKLDDDYLKYSDPTPDKTKIKAALKLGIELEGATLTEKQNMQIK